MSYAQNNDTFQIKVRKNKKCGTRCSGELYILPAPAVQREFLQTHTENVNVHSLRLNGWLNNHF